MKFYPQILWLAGPLLEGLLLTRALLEGWWKKYPIFFGYIACVFLQDVGSLIIYAFDFKNYAAVYWYGEFFSLVLGAGVTWEIFAQVLRRYPGAYRMARNVLGVVLVIGLCKPFVDAWTGGLLWPANAAGLERNLRAVQAASLMVLAVLVAYYRVPLGRNVGGIFVGYGVFIGTTVAALTLGSSLTGFYNYTWAALQPACYIVVLVIWCALLWNYEPVPMIEGQQRIEQDYRSLSVATRRAVLQARAFLGKAIRS